jgi:hypothetical protein
MYYEQLHRLQRPMGTCTAAGAWLAQLQLAKTIRSAQACAAAQLTALPCMVTAPACPPSSPEEAGGCARGGAATGWYHASYECVLADLRTCTSTSDHATHCMSKHQEVVSIPLNTSWWCSCSTCTPPAMLVHALSAYQLQCPHAHSRASTSQKGGWSGQLLVCAALSQTR